MIDICIFQVYALKNGNRYKLDEFNFRHARKDLLLIIALSRTNANSNTSHGDLNSLKIESSLSSCCYVAKETE